MAVTTLHPVSLAQINVPVRLCATMVFTFAASFHCLFQGSECHQRSASLQWWDRSLSTLMHPNCCIPVHRIDTQPVPIRPNWTVRIDGNNAACAISNGRDFS